MKFDPHCSSLQVTKEQVKQNCSPLIGMQYSKNRQTLTLTLSKNSAQNYSRRSKYQQPKQKNPLPSAFQPSPRFGKLQQKEGHLAKYQVSKTCQGHIICCSWQWISLEVKTEREGGREQSIITNPPRFFRHSLHGFLKTIAILN